MTSAAQPQPPGPAASARRARRRLTIVSGVVVLAIGLGTGLALGSDGGSPSLASRTAQSSAGSSAQSAAVTGSDFAYYRSVMGRYADGPMMGGDSYGWMMGRYGYQWMIGGARAPGWMAGGSLPGFMMGSGDDPGEVMGRIWANAPGPRVSPAEAARLGNEAPAGATLDHAANRITFTSSPVRIVVLASPSMPAENFRIAGMTDPAIVVPAGAAVRIELINADDDMAHGLVITARGASSSEMPMMSYPPAFSGAALWFLGEPTSAGMHAGTLSFTASTPGSYEYLCPVPGHAREGMAGRFVVSKG